jgi:hypothetical protein
MLGVVGTTLAIGGAMALVIGTVGTASTAASIGLITLGGAALGIGYGINLAATGMATFAESLSKISSPNIGSGLLQAGLGIGALGAGMTMLGNPAAMLGIVTLGAVGATLLASQGGFNSIGNAFSSITSFMNAPSANLDKLKQTIDTLKDADTSIFTAISDLKTLLSKPIKMEFADKSVDIRMNVDLYLDKDKVSKSLDIVKTVYLQKKAMATGTGTGK